MAEPALVVVRAWGARRQRVGNTQLAFVGALAAGCRLAALRQQCSRSRKRLPPCRRLPQQRWIWLCG